METQGLVGKDGIPAFCVTCKDLPGRWGVTDQHLRKNGIEAEPFYAPSAKRFGMAAKELHARAPTWIQEMNGRHLMCGFGHYVLWRKLQYMTHDITLVLEDDVVLADRFHWKLEIVLDYLPDDWQFAHIGHLGYQGYQPVSGPVGKVVGLHPFGTHCYLINKSGVDFLCENVKTINLPIDVLLGMEFWPKMGYYCAKETLAYQRSAMHEWPSTTNGS